MQEQKQPLTVAFNTMLTFSTNSANFIGRVFFLLGTILIVYILMTLGLKDANNGRIIFRIGAFNFKPFYLLYFIDVVLCYLAVTIAASLLSINKVEVDTNTDTLTFISLFSSHTIVSGDIKEYFETTHRNAIKSFYGLLLKLNDNRRIQVAGQNVESLSELKDYLSKKKINCGGQTKMKFPFN